MAQNIPERLTVSLHAVEEKMKYIANGSYATGRIRRHGQFVRIKVLYTTVLWPFSVVDYNNFFRGVLGTLICVRCQAGSETTVLRGTVGPGNEATSPAVHHNGVVASPHLYLGGFLNHISD